MAKIFIAGHGGMVGSALYRKLNNSNNEIITANRSKLDLTNQNDVLKFFKKNHFDQVYLAAAKVGGIHANNTFPADFIYQNLMIQNNIIHSSYITGIKKLLFLGSSCIYPKHSNQPMSESELLTGHLEPTNEPYAIAKIAGIKMCESYNRQYNTDYRSVMPTNLYGPGDNYHPLNSHVIPGLLKRFHEAKLNKDSEVVAWGTGNVKREFLYVDDMASASIFVMNLDINLYKESTNTMMSHLNVGAGKDYTIKELTQKIAHVVGFEGVIKWDTSKPDGAPKKLMNSSALNKLGWSQKISLTKGLNLAYEDFLKFF